MNAPEAETPFSGESFDFAEMSRDELQAKLFELLTLVETSRELLRARDSDDVARRVLLSSIGVLGAGSACVLLRRPQDENLELVHQLGLEVEGELIIPLPDDLADAFVRERSIQPFRAGDPRLPGAASAFVQDYGAGLAALDPDLICPLVGSTGLLGFLVLGRRLLAEGYTRGDLDLFASLAELYVLALERAPMANFEAPSRPAPTVAHARRTGDNRSLAELRRRHPALREILGESEAMQRFFEDLVDFADSRATLLIQGESGTGKELVAKAVHEVSRRRNGPLEIVDCSSIPKELIESELFGHVRGSFTGAVRDRRGAFDLAHEGTIFLDEIGDMTLGSQTRLLRVLQEGKFRPVGGEKTHSVDVRVIAATNVDLRQAVREGQFRKDLFYRIQVFPLRLPPLRERVGDVEVLLRAFLERFSADEGHDAPPVDEGVFERLAAHPFPGNVRELQNIAEALAIRSRGESRITVVDLEDIFHNMQVSVEREDDFSDGAVPTSWRPSPAPEEGRPTTAPGGDGEAEAGPFVVRAWRDASFNLLEASRRAHARRLDGEPVPVVDRAQMSHYLDGETLALFLETGDLEAATTQLTENHGLRHRAAKRMRRVLIKLCDGLEEEPPAEAFPRLPEEYRAVIRRLEELGPVWIRERL